MNESDAGESAGRLPGVVFSARAASARRASRGRKSKDSLSSLFKKIFFPVNLNDATRGEKRH
jgi:hypothetical protein